MTGNPYQVPQGEISVSPELRPGSPLKAVFLGLLADIGGTTIASFIIGIAYAILLAKAGVPSEEISKRAASIDSFSTLGLLAIAAGLLCSVWGGYVCARISKIRECRNAAIMALLSCSFGYLLKGPAMSWLELLVLSLLGVVAIFLGTWLGIRLNKRECLGAGGIA